MARPAKCPFFGYTRISKLVCFRDGPDAADKSALRLSFPSEGCCIRYWGKYCCDNWKCCTLAAALADEYSRCTS